MFKKNPIISELAKLKVINNKRLFKVSDSTRDIRKLRVFKDLKSGVYLLDKYITSTEYYKNLKTKNDLNKISRVLLSSGIIKSYEINDDQRRFNQFKNITSNKDILDFGCGWGRFLKLNQKAKKRYGIELRKECINFINRKIKNINIFEKLEKVESKFDIITMFHVLEHLPSQIETLKKLKKKLKKNGKIIIEVPSSNDFLLKFDDLKSFKKFTFWSEHLILHNEVSLKKILSKVGFKRIKFIYFQRYNFNNHLGWFIKGKPGGHEFNKNVGDKKILDDYRNFLIRTKSTDTIIAIAS